MKNGDQDRIMQKAYELWESEGRPHGRDREHWDQAKEIVALHDSAGSALLPRNAGADTPVEERSVAIDNEGQAPNLTDTGEHDLTAIDREPDFTAPIAASAKSAKAAKAAPAKPAAAEAAKSASPKNPAATSAAATSNEVKSAPTGAAPKKAAAKRATAPAELSTSADVPAKKPANPKSAAKAK